MNIVKIFDDSSLLYEIDQDAAGLKIDENTEPRFNPPPDEKKNQIPLGELPDDLKVLYRLKRWYNRKLIIGESLGANESNDSIKNKKKIVEAFFDDEFIRFVQVKKRAVKIPAGYVAHVFKGWRVIAYPKYY